MFDYLNHVEATNPNFDTKKNHVSDVQTVIPQVVKLIFKIRVFPTTLAKQIRMNKKNGYKKSCRCNACFLWKVNKSLQFVFYHSMQICI